VVSALCYLYGYGERDVAGIYRTLCGVLNGPLSRGIEGSADSTLLFRRGFREWFSHAW
jgi:hypothetical protein